MYSSKNIISTIIIASFSKVALATSLGMPSANVPSGYDRITTESGITCESTIASDTYLQAGLMGVTQDNAYSTSKAYNHNNMRDRDELGAYVQVIVPIGEKRDRLNCKRFEQLEIERLKAEIENLKMQKETTVDAWDYYEEEKQEPQVEPSAVEPQILTIDEQRGVTLFEQGSSRMNSVHMGEIDELIRFMHEHVTASVTIVGHTDSVGSESANMRLSEQRAKAIARYMLESGVEPNRVHWRGEGETRPIDSNESESGRSRNRRVEIIVQ